MALAWYKWHHRAFAADTAHLPLEVRGAYRELLDWANTQDSPIPDGTHYAIARCVTVTERHSADRALREFFHQVEGGGWVNDRAERERPIREAKSQSAEKAALAAAKKRWMRNPCATETDSHEEMDANRSSKTMQTLDIRHKTSTNTPLPPFENGEQKLREIAYAYPTCTIKDIDPVPSAWFDPIVDSITADGFEAVLAGVKRYALAVKAGRPAKNLPAFFRERLYRTEDWGHDGSGKKDNSSSVIDAFVRGVPRNEGTDGARGT